MSLIVDKNLIDLTTELKTGTNVSNIIWKILEKRKLLFFVEI